MGEFSKKVEAGMPTISVAARRVSERAQFSMPPAASPMLQGDILAGSRERAPNRLRGHAGDKVRATTFVMSANLKSLARQSE